MPTRQPRYAALGGVHLFNATMVCNRMICDAVAPQYDKFRERFLWGRRPLLAGCAARLRGRSDLIWVDMGGGTGVSHAW